MGQQDRDYWRNRYNKTTNYLEQSQLRAPYRKKPFYRRLFDFMTSWPIIFCVWAVLATLYFAEKYSPFH